MKTINKLLLLGIFIIYSIVFDIDIRAQGAPQPIEAAECQDFFSNLERGNLRLIKICIEKKPEYINKLNDRGSTPLMIACSGGHTKLAAYLINKGTKVNQVNFHGQTALHFAVWGKSTNCAKILILANIDINKQDNKGKTPIHIAICQKQIELVQYLIMQKADLNITDNLGKTPLHYASFLIY